MLKAMDEDIEKKKKALVGFWLSVPEKEGCMRLLHLLTADGFTAHMRKKEGNYVLWIEDYLAPVQKDPHGFLIENPQLTARLERELRRWPYNRKDGSVQVFPLLLTEAGRDGSEDVIAFIPGKRGDRPPYHEEYRYLTSGAFFYSNLESCVKQVIPEFDIYGMDYAVSPDQWDQIRETARMHGEYTAGVVNEIDQWIAETGMTDDPVLTIQCI